MSLLILDQISGSFLFLYLANIPIRQLHVCLCVCCLYHEKGCLERLHVQICACMHTSKGEDYVEPALLSQ